MSEDPGPVAVAPKPTRWRWIAAGVLLGLVGLGIRGWLYQQPFNSDDVQYFTLADNISLPDVRDIELGKVTRRIKPNSLRFVFLAVPATTRSLFGGGGGAFYSAIYLIAAMSFAGIFALAWVLAGRRTALIAVAIWATSYVAISVDTRLVPDNLGTALGLLGLALIAWVSGLGQTNGVDPPSSRVKLLACAAIAGFLFWASFSTRASFFLFGLLGVIFASMDRRHRWTILAGIAAGGLVGELVELVYFGANYGDPFLRWRTVLGYGAKTAGKSVSVHSAFAGYTAGDLFTRYPRILWSTDSAEIAIHALGLGMFVWWAAGWRDRQRLAKALCGFLLYGFLAFAVTNVSPVVPLMREKLRYYSTAAPMFYIAVAELIALALFREIRQPRLARLAGKRRRLGLVGGLAVAAVVANLAMAADSPQFSRNGNDSMIAVTEVLEQDVEQSGRPRVLYQDFRTARVTGILLPNDDGWRQASGYSDGRSTDFRVGSDGYLLLNWKRLNGNTRRRFVHGPRTHNYYRIVERHPLVVRHRRGAELTDVFFVSQDEISRDVATISDAFPAGWNLEGARDRQPIPIEGDEVTAGGEGRGAYVYSGEGRRSTPPAGSRLDGEQFVQVIFRGRSELMTRVVSYLYWWPETSKRPRKQYMGTVWTGPEPHEFAAWTYLPQDARAHRVVLYARGEVSISGIRTRSLGLHPDDRLRQYGGAWPYVVPDRDLEAVARNIRADRRAAGRPAVLYDEVLADKVVKLMPERNRWSVAARATGRGVVSPPQSSYLVLSWDRLLAEARQHGLPGARVYRYYRAVDDSLLVYRHLGARGLIDVLFAPSEPINRPLVEDRSFPRGWTRLWNSAKRWEPVGATQPVVFTAEDPNDEYLYSSAGPVWRLTEEATALGADQIVEVIAEARGDEIKTLRSALFWWPEGDKKPRRQTMGEALVGTEVSQVAFWTYLPRRATSHRVVFRAGAGVELSNVRVRLLGRVEGDRVEQGGGAW